MEISPFPAINIQSLLFQPAFIILLPQLLLTEQHKRHIRAEGGEPAASPTCQVSLVGLYQGFAGEL